MGIAAGRLDKRITIQRATEGTADDYNQTALSWAAVATRWASIKPLSGQELFLAQQVNAQVTHEVRMRWLDGVTPKDRISYSGRTLNIQSVANTNEHGVEAVLLCKEEL